MTHSYFPSSGVSSLLCGVALKVNAWTRRTAVWQRERREAGGGGGRRKADKRGWGRNRAEKEAATSTSSRPPATLWAGPKRRSCDRSGNSEYDDKGPLFFFFREREIARFSGHCLLGIQSQLYFIMKTPFARHPVAKETCIYVSVTPSRARDVEPFRA